MAVLEPTVSAPGPSQPSLPRVCEGPGFAPGASEQEWLHFACDLTGLGQFEHLVPVISQPKVERSPNSSISDFSKTPSHFNRRGHAVGIPEWPKHRATMDKVRSWAADGRLGCAIVCRLVRAIDIDVPYPALATVIANAVDGYLGVKLPRRTRPNSGKLAMLVIARSDAPIGKADFTVKGDRDKGDGGKVEFLADRQILVLAGRHASGVRYEWEGGLPTSIPEISLEQYLALIGHLETAFGIGDLHYGAVREQGADFETADPVADYLHDQGLVIGGDQRKLFVRCPWEAQHSKESGPSETAWLVAGTGGHSAGHLECRHASCGSRTDADFFEAIGYSEDVAAHFEDLGPLPEGERRKFEFQSVDEMLKRPRLEWIIKKLLPKADLAMIYGPSGGGKTFFAIDLAVHIALGKDFRELKVRQGRVAYIAAEGGVGICNRLEAAQKHYGAQLGNALMTLTSAPNLMSGGDVDALIGAMVPMSPSVVFVDTWAQVTPGANENSGEDMSKALAVCRRIREATGALVVAISHSGKDETKGVRGWSGLWAACDAVISVGKTADAHAATVAKQKDAEIGAVFGFKLPQVPIGWDDDDGVIESCVVVPCEVTEVAPLRRFGAKQRAVIEALHELTPIGGEGVPIEDVLTRAIEAMPVEPGKRDRRREHARRALSELIEQAVIAESNGVIRPTDAAASGCKNEETDR